MCIYIYIYIFLIKNLGWGAHWPSSLYMPPSLGENGQIPPFGKICGKLVLFQKYLVTYHFFSTRVQWARVPSESLAWHYWPGIYVIKKKNLVLDISEIEYLFIVLELSAIEYLIFLFSFFPFSTLCFRWNGLNSQT